MEYSLNEHFSTILITGVCVLCAVLVHYECLRLLTLLLKKIGIYFRVRILFLIFGLLAAHLIEVWIFAFGYFFADKFISIDSLIGATSKNLLEYVYFSVVTYAAVGYGDIVPVGPIRFLASMEALTGLVLVTWSASFTFLEMRVFWKDVK